MNRPSCKGYIHNIGDNSKFKYCHYMIHTGEPRGCSAENRNKKMTRRQYNALSDSERKKVLQDGWDI